MPNEYLQGVKGEHLPVVKDKTPTHYHLTTAHRGMRIPLTI